LDRDKVEGVDHLVRLMIGRDIDARYRRNLQRAEIALECRGLTRAGAFHEVSLQLHKGEILGVGGLVGAGRTAVAETIFGVSAADSGEILMRGKPVDIRSPKDAIARGVGYVPEDRAKDGLFLDMSVAANISAAYPPSFTRGPFLSRHKEAETARRAIDDHSIRTTDAENAIANLSGGNQQKAIIARWLLTDPDILLLDEPTRGVDIGAKEEIFQKIVALADDGRAILLISSDMSELLALSDRIIVFCEGRVTGELSGDDMTEDKVMRAAAVGAHEHLGRSPEA
jgi:ABC-type sugar transport system ATPase subunit